MGVATLLLAATIAQTSLTVTVWPEGRGVGERERWSLRCDPVGGTHPKRRESCAQLARLGRTAFRPLPDDVVCTEIYGGPDDAVIEGTYEGRRVWARFRRRNGCEIERWNRHLPPLPAAGR